MTQDELKKVLEEHRKWLYNKGENRADLRNADLRDADLQNADLRNAYLQDADLQNADLLGAYLQDADLQNADLQNADLRNADLRGADLQNADLPHHQISQYGSLIVWKKLKNNCLCCLEIPPNAKRTATLVGRKCRTDKAFVIGIWDEHGNEIKKQNCWNTKYNLTYKTGEYIEESNYDDDIRLECTSGIHFFLTKEEAEDW